MQLGSVHTQAHDSRDLLLDQGLNLAIIIPLVDAAQNQHARLIDALQSIPARVHVGRLAVVDVAHAIDRVNILEAMGHGFKVGKRLTDNVLADVKHLGRQACCHAVIHVVQPLEGQGGAGNVPAVAVHIEIEHAVMHPSGLAGVIIGRETQQVRLEVMLAQLRSDDRVVVPEDEGIVAGLVLCDAELGGGIVFHLVVIAVQVVGRDVKQHGHIGLELIHVIQLETAQFNDVHVVMLGSDLQRQTTAHITCQAHVQTRFLEDVIGEFGRRCLAIAAGDANHLGIGVATRKFNLAHDGNFALNGLGHHGCCVGDARALHYLVGVEDLFRGVPAFLPGDVILVEQVLIGLPDGAGITQPHVHAFHFGKHCGTRAALASA